MNKIKTKYDKQLGFYHSFYEKVKDIEGMRRKYLRELMAKEDIVLLIETNLGFIGNPDDRSFMKEAEAYLFQNGFPVQVRLFEAPKKTGLSAIFSFGKQEPDKYRLVSFIPAGSYSEEMFEKLFNVYDIQIGYGLQKDSSEILEDIEKGFCKSVRDKEYFQDFIYDSLLFSKLLVTKPILPDEY